MIGAANLLFVGQIPFLALFLLVQLSYFSFTANTSIFCQLRIPINIINPHFEMLALIFYLAQVAQWEFFQPPLGRWIPGTPLVSGTPAANSSAREQRRRGRPCSSCCGKRRRPFGRRFFFGKKIRHLASCDIH